MAAYSQGWKWASDMCMELQPLFTEEDFSQLRRELNGPSADAASHGFPTGIHCPLLHLPFMSLRLSQWGLYETRVGNVTTSNGGEPNDRFMSWNTCYTLVIVFTSVPVFAQLPICSWKCTEELSKKEERKHKRKTKIDGGTWWQKELTQLGGGGGGGQKAWGKICFYPQRTQLVCLWEHRDSLRSCWQKYRSSEKKENEPFYNLLVLLLCRLPETRDDASA